MPFDNTTLRQPSVTVLPSTHPKGEAARGGSGLRLSTADLHHHTAIASAR
jgi:hypothetical protein